MAKSDIATTSFDAAARLTHDFGGRSPTTQRGVQSLYLAIVGSKVRRGQQALDDWLAQFRAVCGETWPKPTARLDLLAAFYQLPPEQLYLGQYGPEAALFALHTWYVILTRLLAAHLVAKARKLPSPVDEFAQASTGVTRKMISCFAHGEIFKALRVTDPCPGSPFDWYADAPHKSLGSVVQAAAEIIAGYDDRIWRASGDVFHTLYESLFPRRVRHALGEYYTPPFLVEHILDQVDYYPTAKDVNAPHRLLDPTCGSGAFLTAALRRLRNARGPDIKLDELLTNIVGIDLHPLAVASSRANYLLAIIDLIQPDEGVVLPVYQADVLPHERTLLTDPRDTLPMSLGQFDFIVGNPPWVAWDNLPQVSREATRWLWQKYGLFSLSGTDARHGGAKKDLSMLVLYACADRFLKTEGRLGMVITQTIFQSKGAGDGFRRFQLGPGGQPLGVLRVDDMTALRPFAGAANWTSTVVLEKGRATDYPVAYVKWHGHPAHDASAHRLKADATTIMQARPIDARQPASPWMIEPSGHRSHPWPKSTASDYTAHLGANSGGANAVYWLELLGRAGENVRVANWTAKAKMKVDRVEAEIEPGLIYPLLRWTDVRRWRAQPSAYLLLAQDPQTRTGLDEARLARDHPKTLAYLKQFEPMLVRRAAYKRYQGQQPFYSMYNVGTYTVAPYKVVWRRMDRQIRAVVVEEIEIDGLGRKPIVPQETCVLVACESSAEAHYLCALMNSDFVNRIVSSHSVAGGKGFGTPSVLDYLPIRKFIVGNEDHEALSTLSAAAHAATEANEMLDTIIAEIDRIAEKLCDGTEFGSAVKTTNS